ncbi:restriction endonuclease subunit S [Bacillus cereus]|uniref:restriction endonuclease subunit S n=1 Tax=Bacillus cereus TaxID=1396 RepID=UPI003980C091
MEFSSFQLSDICSYRKEKIKATDISEIDYISTDNMLADKKGIKGLSNLPKKGNVNVYKSEDTLISNIRPYFKKIWFSYKDGGCSADVLVFEAKKELILSKYLYYLLSQNEFFDNMVQTSKGTKMPRGDKDAIMKYEVKVPPKAYQKRVVDFLSNIDKKINTNEKIINNLEQLSQTIFKHWFIDFEFQNKQGEPYKSSGGEMVESELGEIPKEWRAGTIDEIGTVVGGGTPSKKHEEYYTSSGISWITPKDLSNNKNIFIYKGAVDITELGLKKGSAQLLPKDTVLFSSRAPIGYIAIAGQDVTTNQGFKSVVPDKGFNNYFIFYLLKAKLPTIEAAAGGSTFKEISGKGLKEIAIIIPLLEIVEEFKNVVEPLFLKINSLERENEILEQLRDTLLPKLLSGEIEISDELVVD